MLLLFTTDVIHENGWDYVWPSVFGGQKLACSSQRFQGAWGVKDKTDHTELVADADALALGRDFERGLAPVG